jgi:hypothetical protein
LDRESQNRGERTRQQYTQGRTNQNRPGTLNIRLKDLHGTSIESKAEEGRKVSTLHFARSLNQSHFCSDRHVFNWLASLSLSLVLSLYLRARGRGRGGGRQGAAILAAPPPARSVSRLGIQGVEFKARKLCGGATAPIATAGEWLQYRDTSLMRNSAPPGPYNRTSPRALWWS